MLFILRFPSSVDSVEMRELLYSSSYNFNLNEDKKMLLDLRVKDSEGNLVRNDQFLRTDIIDRKYSITTSDRLV